MAECDFGVLGEELRVVIKRQGGPGGAGLAYREDR